MPACNVTVADVIEENSTTSDVGTTVGGLCRLIKWLQLLGKRANTIEMVLMQNVSYRAPGGEKEKKPLSGVL